MADSPPPLPPLRADMASAEVLARLRDFFQTPGQQVVVSEFSAFCRTPGKRSFLLSFENHGAAFAFAQAHGLTVFGYSGVLLAVD